MTRDEAIAFRAKIELAAAAMPDAAAVDAPELFPKWAAGCSFTVGENGNWQIDDRDSGISAGSGYGLRIRHGKQLYRVLQEHTAQENWTPEMTPALYAAVGMPEAGGVENPIEAVRGMEYECGKYYRDGEDGLTYLCTRGEETGKVILQYLPHELVGIYFEIAE